MTYADCTPGASALRILAHVIAALTIAAASASAQADPVIYTQPYLNNGTLTSSQNDTSAGGFGAFATTYDNFTLAANMRVTDVHWTGGYFNGAPAAPTSFT